MNLLNKCIDDNMNVIIDINIKLDNSHEIYKIIDTNSDNPGDAFGVKAHGMIISGSLRKYVQAYCQKYEDIFDRFVDRSFGATYEKRKFLYNIEFVDGSNTKQEKLCSAYKRHVYTKMLDDTREKFNIFDYEICSICPVHAQDDYFENTIKIHYDNDKLQTIPIFLRKATKHNFTNENTVKCEYGISNEVCVVIDETQFEKDMFKSQLDFAKCLKSDYIIVLTNSKNKLTDNISYRTKNQ